MTETAADEPAVFINWHDRDADEWEAVWQHGAEYRHVTGTKHRVLDWAARQQAMRHWIYDGSEFVPWDPDAQSPGR